MSFEWINPTRYPAPMLLRLATPEEIAGPWKAVVSAAPSANDCLLEPTPGQLQQFARLWFEKHGSTISQSRIEAFARHWNTLPSVCSFVFAELAKCAPTPGQKAA